MDVYYQYNCLYRFSRQEPALLNIIGSPPPKLQIVSPGINRRWVTVLMLTLCGYLAGYNVGKVAAALPFIRADLDLSLFKAGTVASSYSVAAMFLATLVGLFVSRFGAVLAVFCGVSISGLAGVVGASADSYLPLLGSRLAEGIGYILLAISIPILIAKVISEKSRPLAMGLWGTFIPGGVALSMLLSVIVQNYTVEQWRPLWWFACGMSLFCLVLLIFAVLPVLKAVDQEKVTANGTSVAPALHHSVFERDPILLAVCFGLYSMFFVTLVTYLPTVLTETSTLSVQHATRVSVFVVMCNILGNLLGGWLIGRGVRLKSILTFALLGSCLCSSVVFIEQVAVQVRVGCGLLACLTGGMLPASVFASIPRFVPAQKSGLLLGVVFQTLSAGQVAGPVVLASLVEFMGAWWSGAVYFFFVAVVSAIVLWFFQHDSAWRNSVY